MTFLLALGAVGSANHLLKHAGLVVVIVREDKDKARSLEPEICASCKQVIQDDDSSGHPRRHLVSQDCRLHTSDDVARDV